MGKPCTICGGAKEEHGPSTIHAYSSVEGDLTTPEQRAAQQGRQQPINPAALMGAAMNPLVVGRLVEVLMAKSIFTQEEGLYIAGFGPRPPAFQDPVVNL